jgi:hypothetical protein
VSSQEEGDGALSRLLTAGRERLLGAVDAGRSQLRVRALQRDLDHFWIRLGKTAWRLVEAGEVHHPALDKAVERIRELEEELQALQRDQDHR